MVCHSHFAAVDQNGLGHYGLLRTITGIICPSGPALSTDDSEHGYSCFSSYKSFFSLFICQFIDCIQTKSISATSFTAVSNRRLEAPLFSPAQQRMTRQKLHLIFLPPSKRLLNRHFLACVSSSVRTRLGWKTKSSCHAWSFLLQ